MSPKVFSEDLAALARAGERKRDAALLRATTELYVLEETHDRDAIRRFEELATHFLAKVEVDDRLFVAERLAPCVDAPSSVMRTLARDVIAVATPVIVGSPVLGSVDLLSVIAATGAEHHRLIAQRPSLPIDVVRALCLTGDAGVRAALDAKEHPLPEADDFGEAGRDAELDQAIPPIANRLDPWAFLGLDRRGRFRVIADIAQYPPASYVSDSVRLDRAFQSILSAAQIVGFARARHLPAIIDAISEGLALPHSLVAAAIHDAGGELLAVMLKALRLTDAQARQVFLLASPSGRDVTRFFPLSDLYAGMEPTLAETLVAAWRDSVKQGKRRHEQHFAPDTASRGLGTHDTKRRDLGQPDAQARRA